MDINLLKPSRIEFVHNPGALLAVSDTQASKPQWLEYIYRTAHPVLVGCPQSWLSGLGRTCRMCLVFLIKLIRGLNLALAGPLQSSTIFFMSMLWTVV